MPATPWIFRLSLLIALMGGIAAAAGLFSTTPEGPSLAASVRGDVVPLYGSGLYRHDSRFSGAAFRGTDAVTLFLALPLLLAAAFAHRRGSIRGSLLLSGMLCYFLYVYASLSLATAFNEFFLVYVALFSASFFAFLLLLAGLMGAGIRFAGTSRRGTGSFLVAAGILTVLIWVEAPLSSLLAGRPPGELAAYTTLFTHALDMAIIAPAVIIAGAMVLQRDHRGYVLAAPLLCLLVSLLPMMAAQTWAQLAAGITFSPGQAIGIIGGFGVLALAGGGVLWRLLQAAPGPPLSLRRGAAGAPAEGYSTGVNSVSIWRA
jgi:hypothetical protein